MEFSYGKSEKCIFGGTDKSVPYATSANNHLSRKGVFRQRGRASEDTASGFILPRPEKCDKLNNT